MHLKAVADRPVTTRSAVLQGPLRVEMEERKLGEPGPLDVLVKMMAVGVCGSDVHYYEHGRIGNKQVEYPFIQGHECSGVVVGAGNQVTRVNIGDRVAIEPGAACLRCEYCKSGQYNLCPSVQFLSSPPTNGAFTQYLIHPEHLLFPIPDRLSFEAATLAEPLSVGIHACQRAGLATGATVLVTGLGPVGLTAVIAAKALGAKQIIVSDVEPFRLKLAERLGASAVVHAAEQSVGEQVLKATQGKGADIAIDTSGHPDVLNTAIEVVKRGGKLVSVGFPGTETVPLNLTQMLLKEIDLCTVYRYANTYPLAIQILASGEFDIAPLITDRYFLEETGTAMERARTNKSGSLKVIVYPHGHREGTDQ
ncbi:NAD(P)-dependent alcohol dehydrogenase [Paenibacillus thalictri]|uniref:NAD(P)-dependent alcohol dehydrogenase n=1 Tax=Paenibacillus thalictri TaxID=2527873 RepID=A0A4Q9DGL6_9BACL|nr:NAD(P)-dependent alcohol dehydrogenase [Paenibacillus thalictri]TBL69892.1 NAD(P)-dependent alcohol dehydrogenase [Paenibacillus thalictri]